MSAVLAELKKEGAGPTAAVVDGLATVGRVQTVMTLVMLHIIFAPLLLLGLYLVLRRRKPQSSVKGQVANEPRQCTTTTTTSPTGPNDPKTTTTTTECLLDCTFTLPGDAAARTQAFTVDGARPWSVGQTVTVWFDPEDPAGTASLQGGNPWPAVGWFLIVLSMLFLVPAWVHWYLVRRFRAFAAFGAVTSLVGKS